MSKILTTITAIFIFSSICFKASGSQYYEDSIKVGILHSITGTMAISERSLVDATLLAIDKINKEGGINGRYIKAIVEDGASDWNIFAQKAKKLIEQDKVCSIFGCWTSASRKAVLPIIESTNNLLWYPLQYEGGESSANVIYTGATPNQQIFPALDWCLTTLGKRFFLVGSDYLFPREANKQIKSYLKEHGGIIVGEEYLPLGDQNFKNIVRVIHAEQPDVIFNTVNGDSNIGLFLELYSSFSDKRKMIPVMSVSIAEEELRSLGTKLTVGNYCAWTYFQSVPSPENESFVNAFKEKYGQSRVTSDPIEAAYTQVLLFAEALKKSASLNPEEIKRNTLGITITAPGGLIKIDPNNQHAWKAVRIGQVRIDGQFDILSGSEAPIQPDPYPEIFFKKGKFTQQQNQALLKAAEEQFSKASNTKAKINVLKRFLNSSNQEEILFAFGKIKEQSLSDASLLPAFSSLLDNEEPLLVQEAIDAIGNMGKKGKDALPKLIKMSQSSYAGVRYRSGLAICNLATMASMSDDVSYLKELQQGVSALEENEFSQFHEYEVLKQTVKSLERARKAGFLEGLYKSINDNFWYKVIFFYLIGFILVTFIWWVRPMVIYRINNFLKVNLDYVLFGGVNISIPLTYVLLVGFFYHTDRILDAWIKKQLLSAQSNFTDLDTVRSRSVYIPVPVAIDKVSKPDFVAEDLMPIMEKKRWCILIHGEGGTGKTSLACQIGKWALQTAESGTSGKKLMIPVLIEPGSGTDIDDMEKFKGIILGHLNAVISSNDEISLPFLDALLRAGRILVIVDDVSVLGEKEWTLPNSRDFTISSLVVTSRKREKLGNIPCNEIQTLKVSGEQLSNFIGAYLTKRNSRTIFSDDEFFKACERLTRMVGERGNRSITILFAKMYADQMIGMKESGYNDLLPHDIPEMMLHFIDQLNKNRQPTMAGLDSRTVQQATRIIAWECCKENLYPNVASVDAVLLQLGENGKQIISYLETELRLIQITGTEYDKIKFSLDTLAEYYASFYVISKFNSDSSLWRSLIARLEDPEILNTQSNGFLLALTDTVNARAAIEGVPEHVISSLSDISQSKSPGTKKIRVGVLHSMTGSMSISERSLVDAIKLSIDEINAEGGIMGKELQAYFEDGASDWNVFKRKARKLILEDNVCSVFGCWTSASRKAVLPVFEEFNNLLWYPIQYEGGESSPNIIYSGATPNQQIIPALDWCLKNLGKKIFLIGSDYIFPREANSLIKKYLRQFDISPCGEEYVALGDRDFSAIIQKVVASGAEVIFNTVNGDSNMGLFQELHRNNLRSDKLPVMSVSIAEDELLGIGTNLAVGNYCAWNYFQSVVSPENETFVSDFKKVNGMNRVTDDPIESSYIQIKLFAKAVTLARSIDSRAIRNAAKGLEMQTPRGLIKIDPENQHTWKQARIGKIRQDGQFEILWTSPELIRPEPFAFVEKPAETADDKN